MVKLQYDLKKESQNNIGDSVEYSIIPVDIGLYESVMRIFMRALGMLYDTDYYIAKKPEYLK